MKKITIFSVVLLLFTQLNFSQDTYKRVSINNINDATINILHQEGIDITCGAIFQEGSLNVELSQYELDKLSDRGITYNILIEDMVQFYSQRAIEDLPRARRQLQESRSQSSLYRSYSVDELLNNVGQYNECDEIDWAVPANWKLNDATNYPAETNHFGGCLTYQMVQDELDLMKTLYPNIISTKTNASPSNQLTYEGRTVWMVRISDNPDTDETEEAETLYQSLIHSRESATIMNQLYFMWYILENYASDPAIQNLVNNQELYFIPVFNPDGFEYNRTQAPNGGGGQRKNRNVDVGGCGTYLFGVDLNRNSAYYWGNGGSSTNGCNDTYMGTGQFSENETQIMRDFFLQHDFKLSLNHHSYKNAMLHAYAGTTITNPRPDEYSKYNHDMTYYNRYAHGPSTSISSLNSGNMNDWMLGGPAGTSANGTPTGTGSGKNTMAWTPENGLRSEGPSGGYGGFWPFPSNFLPIAKRAMRMNFLAAYFSGKYAKLHDFNQTDISGNGNLNFAIENLGQNGSDLTPNTNAFTLTVTAVSPNITITGLPVTENFTAAQILDQRNASISYTLDAGIQPNDSIEYKVVLTNDNATDNVLYEANIVKHYTPNVVFYDNTNDLSNWTPNGTWYNTADAYPSASAITTTNVAPYANGTSKSLQMNGSVNLTGISTALIQFYAKWDLERSFDYVQIEGSTNGSTWTPLCGKLTKPGAPNANNSYSGKGGVGSADNNFQPDGEPLYDGDTQDKWNMEEIVIDASTNSFLFNQNTVYLRFGFNTDSSNREDSYYNVDFEGFTFDDFKIINIQLPCVTSVPTGISVSSITNNSATVDWDFIPSATYDLRYRVIGAPSWTEITDIASNSYNITGLTVNDYEVQVRSRCTTLTSVYSSSLNFSIENCTGPSVASFPYPQDFETDFGLWTQPNTDDFDWTRDSGGTPTNNSGPSSGANSSTFYAYTESNSPNNPSKLAELVSPCINLTDFENAQIEFYYHWYGMNIDMATLRLEVSNDNGATYTTEFTKTGASSNMWVQQIVDLSAYDGQTIKIKFSGITGDGNRSDMAIDEINISADPLVLNVESNTLDNVLIQPNPFNDSVVIKIPSELNLSTFNIILFDLNGRVIYEKTTSNSNGSINLSGLDRLVQGSYFIKILNKKSGDNIVKKLIKL